MSILLAGVAALLLVSVHVVAPYLKFLEGTPRSAWLSLAGGVSVAYVFVHLLPELAEGQDKISKTLISNDAFAERHVYLIALLGLAVFYGLDRLAKSSRSKREGRPVQSGRAQGGKAKATTSAAIFWIHIGSFGVYNALIGYLLLHREVETLLSLAFFAVAMALHFFVTDFSLNEDHKTAYVRTGRWILLVALLLGWALGYLTTISDAALAVMVAFLAGGVILNVLKEEVPSERQSRFWAFALGIVGYAALLLTF